MVDPYAFLYASSDDVLRRTDRVDSVVKIMVRQLCAVERFDFRFKAEVPDFRDAARRHVGSFLF